MAPRSNGLDVVVVMDQAAVKKFVGWTGPVGKSVTRLAKETVFRQKIYANKKTGQMAAGIYWKKGAWRRGIQFDAGSDSPKATWTNQGTRPHVIRAKNAPMLVFFWPKVGQVVEFKSVNHPGNRPYRWLQRGLEKALRVWDRSG